LDKNTIIKNNPKKCCYCGGCVAVCPVGALELDETKIVYDEKKCIRCGACVKICPVGAMKLEKK
jgi:ferredoxin